MIGYRRVMQGVERRGHARDVVEALLDRDVRDRALFENQQALREPRAAADDARARRHGRARRRAQRLAAADRGSVERLSATSITSAWTSSTTGEYRTLAASYADIRDLVRAMRKGPVEIRTVAGAREEEPVDEAGETVDRGAHGR